jgi:hypothetical protein
MAEQLALQAKEIQRLNILLLRQSSSLQRFGFSGPFRLFSHPINIGVNSAFNQSIDQDEPDGSL